MVMSHTNLGSTKSPLADVKLVLCGDLVRLSGFPVLSCLDSGLLMWLSVYMPPGMPPST